MDKLKKIYKIVSMVYEVLLPDQRRRSVWAFLAMLLASVLELLGVSLIVPFVTSIMSEDILGQSELLSDVCNRYGITEKNTVVTFMALSVLFAYLLKNAMILYARYMQNRYCRQVNKELTVTMLSSYVVRPYEFFIDTNTSEILRGVNNDIDSFFQVMQVIFGLLAELLTVSFIIVFIFATDFITAISVLFVSGIIVLLIAWGTRSTSYRVALKKRDADYACGRILLELIGGIKDIYVLRKQRYFIRKYEGAVENRQKAILINELVLQIPERVIEFAVVGGVVVIVSIRVQCGYDTNQYIPQLAALAVACFRLLPSLNKITSAYNQIIYHYPGMKNVYDNIGEARNITNHKNDAIVKHEKQFEFCRELRVNRMSWKYAGAADSLFQDLSFNIAKGESIAFVGKSGSGKTTLADIILGLLIPQRGSVAVDGVDIYSMGNEWSRYVGYVPQTIFLMDDTIRANIAFGCEDIDDEKVWSALKKAQLDEFVKSLPNGINTVVGERGVKFSGGQRQRIAIARVMYYDPEILVFDEATSALDDGTEQAVMEAINSLKGLKTMIIIAHRLSTIKNCDRIYEIVDGKAIEHNKNEYL